MESVQDRGPSATGAGAGGPTGASVDLAVWRDIASGGWALAALIDQELARRRLSIAEMRILESVDSRDTATVGEVADMCHARLSTVSRQIGRLVRRGALERIPDVNDARLRFVRLSAKGRATLDDAYSVRRRVVDQHVTSVLTDDELRTVASAFQKITTSVRRTDTVSPGH